MFSATMPPEVLKLAKTYLKNPITIQIGDPDSVKNKRIEQVMLMMPSESSKMSKLKQLLLQWLDR